MARLLGRDISLPYKLGKGFCYPERDSLPKPPSSVTACGGATFPQGGRLWGAAASKHDPRQGLALRFVPPWVGEVGSWDVILFSRCLALRK